MRLDHLLSKEDKERVVLLFGYQVSHADTTAGEMPHVYMEGGSEAGVDIGRMPFIERKRQRTRDRHGGHNDS